MSTANWFPVDDELLPGDTAEDRQWQHRSEVDELELGELASDHLRLEDDTVWE